MIKNESIYKELLDLDRKLSPLEDHLLKNIPHAFVNFLDIPYSTFDDVIQKQTSIIKKSFQFTNQAILKDISEYIQLSNHIYNNFKIPEWVNSNYMDNIETNFIFSMMVSQFAKLELLKPDLAEYQLKKVLSIPEKSLYSSEEVEIEDLTDVSLEIPELLIKDTLGNFSPEETINFDTKTKKLKVYFSVLKELMPFSDYFFKELQNNSLIIPFALLNASSTKEICAIVTGKILGKISEHIYKLMEENVLLINAREITKRKVMRTAIEYLNQGNSKSDELSIGKTIYQTAHSQLEKNKDLKPDFVNKASEEFLRIGLSMLTKWFYIPSHFFSFKIREAKLIEKISPEINYSIDIFIIDDTNKINEQFYETEVVMFTNESRNVMNVIASKGIQNSKNLTEFVDKQIQPNYYLRMMNKFTKNN